MKLVIIQPAYFPWPKYYARLLKADTVVFLDHVPMDRSSKSKTVNRARIDLGGGREKWLTIPITKEGKTKPIRELVVANVGKCFDGHYSTLYVAYHKAPYWGDLKRLFLNSIPEDRKWAGYVAEYSIRRYFIEVGFQQGLPRYVFRSSELDCAVGTKSELILNICKGMRATSYLSGPFGRDYLDPMSFQGGGIDLQYDDSPIKPHPDGRVGRWSILDTVAYLGLKGSYDYLSQ